MKDAMDDIDEPLEDEVVVAEEDLDELEPSEADLEEAAEPAGDAPDPADPAATAEVESIQDLLVKQEARAEEEEAEEEDETAVALTRDERLEPLDTRVVPMQAGYVSLDPGALCVRAHSQSCLTCVLPEHHPGNHWMLTSPFSGGHICRACVD